jgi:hypothetical protein
MKENLSHRDFLQKSAITAGMKTLGALGIASGSVSGKPVLTNEKLPKKVWIASFS